MTAIEHLKLWKIYADNWCEHKPSITVSVKEDEWLGIPNFVYQNFDSMSGISFLPMTEHTYKQAPYQDVSKEKWEEALLSMPKEVYWESFAHYETEDRTTGSQEFACTANSCEIVDFPTPISVAQ